MAGVGRRGGGGLVVELGEGQVEKAQPTSDLYDGESIGRL